MSDRLKLESPPRRPTVATIDEGIRLLIREELQAMLEELAEVVKPAPEWVDTTGLCKALDVTPMTIRKMIREGCPHIRPSTQLRFNLKEVIEWARSRGNGNES